MDNNRSSLTLPLVGSAVALSLSPLVVALTRQMGLYPIILFPLVVVLWAVTRLSRRQMGIRIGNYRGYLVPLLYPLGVMGLTGVIAWVSGGIQASSIYVIGIAKAVAVLLLFTFAIGLITEEAFFRGWLWGALRKSACEPRLVLVWTSLAFALWHLAVPFVEPYFRFPLTVLPVYIANCFLIGMVFGFTRLATGSVVASAFCHALWNAMTYTLYGSGVGTGAFKVASYQVYDPERGVLGLLLNLIAVMALRPWRVMRHGGMTV